MAGPNLIFYTFDLTQSCKKAEKANSSIIWGRPTVARHKLKIRALSPKGAEAISSLFIRYNHFYFGSFKYLSGSPVPIRELLALGKKRKDFKFEKKGLKQLKAQYAKKKKLRENPEEKTKKGDEYYWDQNLSHKLSEKSYWHSNWSAYLWNHRQGLDETQFNAFKENWMRHGALAHCTSSDLLEMSQVLECIIPFFTQARRDHQRRSSRNSDTLRQNVYDDFNLYLEAINTIISTQKKLLVEAMLARLMVASQSHDIQNDDILFELHEKFTDPGHTPNYKEVTQALRFLGPESFEGFYQFITLNSDDDQYTRFMALNQTWPIRFQKNPQHQWVYFPAGLDSNKILITPPLFKRFFKGAWLRLNFFTRLYDFLKIEQHIKQAIQELQTLQQNTEQGDIALSNDWDKNCEAALTLLQEEKARVSTAKQSLWSWFSNSTFKLLDQYHNNLTRRQITLLFTRLSVGDNIQNALNTGQITKPLITYKTVFTNINQHYLTMPGKLKLMQVKGEITQRDFQQHHARVKQRSSIFSQALSAALVKEFIDTVQVGNFFKNFEDARYYTLFLRHYLSQEKTNAIVIFRNILTGASYPRPEAFAQALECLFPSPEQGQEKMAFLDSIMMKYVIPSSNHNNRARGFVINIDRAFDTQYEKQFNGGYPTVNLNHEQISQDNDKSTCQSQIESEAQTQIAQYDEQARVAHLNLALQEHLEALNGLQLDYINKTFSLLTQLTQTQPQ